MSECYFFVFILLNKITGRSNMHESASYIPYFSLMFFINNFYFMATKILLLKSPYKRNQYTEKKDVKYQVIPLSMLLQSSILLLTCENAFLSPTFKRPSVGEKNISKQLQISNHQNTNKNTDLSYKNPLTSTGENSEHQSEPERSLSYAQHYL